MVWGLLKRKLTEQLAERLEETRDELSHIQEEVKRRNDRVNTVEQQLNTLQQQVEDLSQTVDALHAWDRHIHQKLDAHDTALTELTTLLSTHLPQQAGQGQQALPQRQDTADQPPVDTTKRSIQRPDDESGRPKDDEEAMEQLWNAVTPSQKKVVMALYELGYPASYRELAKELDRSVSTVKNHVNALKAKGVSFEEQRGPDNAKRYRLGEDIRSYLAMKIHA